MSHASLLVALDPTDDVETAVAAQMAPFDEGEKGWFADGSRWDWWQVGGRYTGMLTGYDPEIDPRNIETCELCGGTGKREDLVVVGGCNGCEGTGKHLKWPTSWVSDGSILRRGDVNLVQLAAAQRKRYEGYYLKAQEQKSATDMELFYGVKAGETLEQYLARQGDIGFPAHYAFLRNRVWQEQGRLGFFGGRAATECERAGQDVHICTHEKDGARIVSWSDSDSWDKMFYPRFVEPLPPETLLVTVDYHV